MGDGADRKINVSSFLQENLWKPKRIGSVTVANVLIFGGILKQDAFIAVWPSNGRLKIYT